MNTGMQISLQDLVSILWDEDPELGLLDHVVILF